MEAVKLMSNYQKQLSLLCDFIKAAEGNAMQFIKSLFVLSYYYKIDPIFYVTWPSNLCYTMNTGKACGLAGFSALSRA